MRMTDGNDAIQLPAVADATLTPEEAARPIPRRRVISWALWDWATQPFNSVIITFVFVALYLTQDGFIDPEIRALGEDAPAYERALDVLARNWAWAGALAGIVVALLAPVLGQRADARGRRKWWLGIMSGLLVASMLGLFFVEESPTYFWLGVGLISFGQIVAEIAGVNYNAMLTDVSTPRTVGRVSGLGWGLGYVGGIVALVIVVVADSSDWWGMDTSNGMAYRLIAVGSAVWAIVFGWAVFVFVPESPRRRGAPVVGFFEGYRILMRDLRQLWSTARSTLWFLIASAVYRDGLVGVFAFGAIIAAQAFGFSAQQVIYFGVAANLVAGLSTIVAGRLDDSFGPRRVILAALGTIVVCGVVIVSAHTAGAVVFWVFGLILSACVGPAQAASRSLLARLSPPGHEAEIFGLYATTGRVTFFLSPTAFAVASLIFGGTIWGTIGIVFIVAVGLGLLVLVKSADVNTTMPREHASA